MKAKAKSTKIYRTAGRGGGKTGGEGKTGEGGCELPKKKRSSSR